MIQPHNPFLFVRGLRFRLALSYVIFFALLLTALGVLFRQLLRTTLESQVRAVLNEEWAASKGYLRIDRNGPEWFYDKEDPDEDFTVTRLQHVYLLADIAGHPLERSSMYETLGLDSPADIKAIVAQGQPVFKVRYAPDGTPYLIRAGIVFDERHKNRYFFAVGRSIAENGKTVRAFTRNYFSLLPLEIALAALLGWLVAGRALGPVNSVAETAQRITHSNLDMRIPMRGAKDELDRLIEAFNRMMERLRFSFEQIRQFSTDVSHELRTPLTVIRGQLEVAMLTAKTPEDYREAMADALEDVERLSNIVRALLLLSQSESGQLLLNMTELDLADLVRELVDEFQIPAEAEHVQLAAAELPERLTVRADRIQMERLVSNLLSNAIKYTQSGGQVTVRLEQADDLVRLAVTDTGVGIAPDHLPHIFDRFYRVPSSDPEKGLGLGLSFVAWIVKAHGGSIDVQTEPDKGTTFTVTIPVGVMERISPEFPALMPSDQPV